MVNILPDNPYMFLARQNAFYCIDLYREIPTMVVFQNGMVTWKGSGFVNRFYTLSILFPELDSIIRPGTCSRIKIVGLSIELIEKNVKCNVELYQKENKMANTTVQDCDKCGEEGDCIEGLCQDCFLNLEDEAEEALVRRKAEAYEQAEEDQE